MSRPTPSTVEHAVKAAMQVKRRAILRIGRVILIGCWSDPSIPSLIKSTRLAGQARAGWFCPQNNRLPKIKLLTGRWTQSYPQVIYVKCCKVPIWPAVTTSSVAASDLHKEYRVFTIGRWRLKRKPLFFRANFSARKHCVFAYGA